MKQENIYQPTEETNPFELLNSVNTQKKNLRTFIICLLVLCALLLFGLIRTAGKPPLVIRIDKLGNTDVVKNYAYETKVTTEDDVKNFTNIFLKNYVGLRSDLVVAQFQTSLNMMTEGFSKIHLKNMKDNNTIKTIQAAGVRNNVILQKVDYEEAGDLIYVNASGTLNTRPIEQINAPPQVKSLTADLILSKVRRTPEKPYGLLLKDIKLAIDKANSEVSNNLNEVINNNDDQKINDPQE